MHREFWTILKGWGSVVGTILFLFFLLKVSTRFSRTVVLVWFFLTPFAILAIHGSLRWGLRRLREKGKNLRYGVVIGVNEMSVRLCQHLESSPWTGVRISGFFDDGCECGVVDEVDKPLLGKIVDLKNFVSKEQVDFIYIGLPMKEEEKILSILSGCRTVGAQVYLIPDLYSYAFLNARLETFGDFILLNFNPDLNRKRYFDIAFSIFALLVSLPLLALTAIAIKVEDGGPIFYRHKRVTAAGKRFMCLKLRTMYVDADQRLKEILENDSAALEEWNRTFKLKNDPRVTKVGKLLRKSSLDELPQFFNVLKGEMSVVGARPIVEEELTNYYKEAGGLYCSVKPGITGLWQVEKRSDTEDYEERVELDRKYILNQSLWMDVLIVLKTVWTVLRGKGAY